MSTAIHDSQSRITNMDVVKETNPQLTSDNISNIGEGLTTPYSNITTTSTRVPAVPIITNASLYTTSNLLEVITTHKQADTIDISHLGKLRKPYWIYNLDDALSSISNDHVIIAKQYTKKDGSFGFCYAVYPVSHIPYYVLSVPAGKRVFFEYLKGARKAYFDLELKRESGITNYDINQFNECVRLLLLAISNILASKGVKYHHDTNLITWCSHSSNKLSIHIIIDRHYHLNSLEAKAFYEICVRQIPYDILGYLDDNNKRHIIVDSSVYNNRPFRFPWCTKIGNNRPLIPDPLFKSNYIPGPLDAESILSVNNDKRTTLLTQWLFHHSMICYLVDCQPLPSFITSGTIVKYKGKTVDENIWNIFLDCYNNNQHLTNNYTVREDLSSDYLYLQRKGVVKCMIDNHGSHKSNNSMIAFNSHINAIIFQCFAHNGYKILRKLSDVPEVDDNSSDINEDPGLYFAGFNGKTGELDKDKEYEASLQRNAIPDDVIFFINSLERMPNCNVDTKTLMDKFKLYCNNNKLEVWFKQKQFDDLLLAMNDITKVTDKNGTLFIVGYSTGNSNTIVRPDLPRKITKQQITGKIIVNTTERKQATAIINGEIIEQRPIVNTTERKQATVIINGIIPHEQTITDTSSVDIPKVYVKRPATTEDVKHFIDSIRINDATKSATCPELYKQFNNYCNRSQLYTSVTNRMFTDFIVKSNQYQTTINRKVRIVIGVSLSNGNNVIRKDYIKFGPINTENSTAPTFYPNNNHVLNDNCKINNEDIHGDPINVPQNNNYSVSDIDHRGAVNSEGIQCDQLKEFTENMLRDFWDNEMIQDVNNRINTVAVNKSFQSWCKDNNIYSKLQVKGLSRLLISRLSLRKEISHGISYIVGWNVRRSISKEEHDEKESALSRIFERWTDRYEIGRHNGPYPYYQLGTERWRNIRVKHEYVYTMGTNGRILLPKLESMMSMPTIYPETAEEFILALKADMGAGKTACIKEYIESRPDMRVIYVVPAKNIIFGRQIRCWKI